MDRNFVPFDVIRPAIDVALRKESVDRNVMPFFALSGAQMSLSARRAWIEIIRAGPTGPGPLRRSPQGERG